MTKHTKHTKDTCWSKLPVYRPGGKLSANQLNAEQADSDKRERLLNLALHGWGVVHGFDVATDDQGKVAVKDGCIHVGCGLALDPYGRTLYRETAPLGMDGIVGALPERAGCYTLKAHYAEKTDGTDWDPCHDGTAWKHRCVVFTLTPCCETFDVCPRCQPEDTCEPRRDYVCARTGQSHGKKWQDPELELACANPPELKSSHCGRYRYDPGAGIPLVCVEICDLTDDADHCPPEFGFCACPPPREDCRGDDGDDLPDLKDAAKQAGNEREQAAALTAEKSGLERPKPDTADDCGCDTPSCDMRPVAYRAPLLYELINDADVDLPRVVKYSWSEWALGKWTTRMPVDVFEKNVLACVTHPDGHHENISGGEGFIIAFSKPVDAETLHPLSVLFDLYIRENEYDADFDDELAVNWKQYRVPVAIEPLVDRRDPGRAIGVRICPKKNWWSYAERLIKQCASEGQLARAEITLRGQMIRDKCGCMLDARPPELTCRDHCGRQQCRDCDCKACNTRDPQKTGQARPGGDWVSVFRIGGDTDCECDDAKPQPDEDKWPDDKKHPKSQEKMEDEPRASSAEGDAS